MVRILKKWIKAIFSKHIIYIILGNIYRLLGIKNDLFINRYFACMHCENLEYYKPIGEICGLCGCPLKSKLRIEDEECEIGAW